MATAIENIPLDDYRAEAEHYLGPLLEVVLEESLAAAKQAQTSYAQSNIAYSQQGFFNPNQPMSCPSTPGICDCCVLYKDDCY